MSPCFQGCVLGAIAGFIIVFAYIISLIEKRINERLNDISLDIRTIKFEILNDGVQRETLNTIILNLLQRKGDKIVD